MCRPSGIASFERTPNSSSSRLFRRRKVDRICSAATRPTRQTKEPSLIKDDGSTLFRSKLKPSVSEVFHVVKQHLLAFLKPHLDLVWRQSRLDRSQPELWMID